MKNEKIKMKKNYQFVCHPEEPCLMDPHACHCEEAFRLTWQSRKRQAQDRLPDLCTDNH